MKLKPTLALVLATLVAVTGGSLPAQSAPISAAEVSWSNNTPSPTSATDFISTSQVGVLATRYPFVKFTSALAVGDTFAFSISLSRPSGSQVTLLDSNGSAAGGSAMFSGLTSSNWGTPTYDNTTGLITGTVTTAYSSSAFTRLGSLSLISDAAGEYRVTLTPMSDSGSGWVPAATAKSAVFNIYNLITGPATVVQAAAFGTGVEHDADGNIFWVDSSGAKIYKTNTSGVTTQFSLAPSNTTKAFVEGPWLYVQALDRVYRISTSNANQTATPKIVQGKSGMLSQSNYAQAQGYSRIAGQNYVSMNIPYAGEIWRYPVESKVVDVSSYSVTANVATLTVPTGHGFQVGDSINVYFGGTPYIADSVRTVTEVTATEVKFANATSNVATTSTPNGQVAKSVGAATLLTTVTGAVRGMVPSPDGRYLYIAYAVGKKILRLDLQDLTQAPVTFADLNAVGYAPDDITVLDDGSFVVSAYSSSGALWHIGADGAILDKISMTLGGSAVSGGYDLRVSPDGSKIYLAAQSAGFLSLALSRPLSSSTRGTSNLVQPTSGPIPATAAAASIYDSAASNISTTSALLRGTVNPNGTATQAQLRWSTDPTFPAGSTSSSPIENLTGSTVQAIEYQATGLVANTTYYFQVMAGNLATDEVFGGVRSFNTASLPGITSISVGYGPATGGTSVQLTIQGFSSTPTVKVGGILATNVVFTAPSTLTFDTPTQGGTGIVIESGSLAASAGFVYTAPTISNISPDNGDEAGGFSVTLTGANFSGATALSIAGSSSTFTVVSDTSITFVAPAKMPGSKTVQVSTPSGSTTTQLTYTVASVQNVQPSQTPTPTPTPTPSQTTSTPAPVTPAPVPAPIPSQPPTIPAPQVQAPSAATAVSLAATSQQGKSKVRVVLPNQSKEAPIESVRVQLKNAKGEVTQTFVVPLDASTDSVELDVPLSYGDFDVSVATFNSAGYSEEVLNQGGLLARSTIATMSVSKWPTVKGEKVLPKITFKANSIKLTAAARQSLKAIRNQLEGFTGRIYVSGFAAKFGPSATGRRIASGRAEAVAKALKELGLNQWIEYHGYGQLPSADSAMRRVEVSIQR